jgi:sterol desaturase/sphingolipid hydroxylase (fatty acid hydroxylase superfamily)
MKIISLILLFISYPALSKKIETNLLIKNGEVKTVNLDLNAEFKTIENNGELLFISSSNVSLLIVNRLINNGKIAIQQNPLILQKELSFFHDSNFNKREILKCIQPKCLFLYTKNNIVDKGFIETNGSALFSNFPNSNFKKIIKKINDTNYYEIALSVALFFVFLFTIFLFLLEYLPYKFNLERLDGKKINNKTRFHQVKIAYRNIFFGVFIVTLFVFRPLNELGLIQMYFDIDKHGMLWYILSFPMTLFFFDLYFYLTHKMLHLPWMYKKFHYIHHKSKSPTASTLYYFHFVEQLIISINIPVMLLVMPIHIDALIFTYVSISFLGCYGHSGYKFFPKKIIQYYTPSAFVSKYFMFSSEHFRHHSKNKGFFGLYFKIWDYVFNTHDKSYKSPFIIKKTKK